MRLSMLLSSLAVSASCSTICASAFKAAGIVWPDQSRFGGRLGQGEPTGLENGSIAAGRRAGMWGDDSAAGTPASRAAGLVSKSNDPGVRAINRARIARAGRRMLRDPPFDLGGHDRGTLFRGSSGIVVRPISSACSAARWLLQPAAPLTEWSRPPESRRRQRERISGSGELSLSRRAPLGQRGKPVSSAPECPAST